MGRIRAALDKMGLKSEELIELYKLENDDGSWLFHAKAIRDHSTHISNVPRHFHVGGDDDNLTYISNPKTGKVIERHLIDEFVDWLAFMKETILRLRSSAIRNTQPKDNQIDEF